jgi:glycerate kinase
MYYFAVRTAGSFMSGNVLIAMDSFKGSITGNEAGRIIAESFETCLPASRISRILLADGGEGSLAVLEAVTDDMMTFSVDSYDPAGDPVVSLIGYCDRRREAFIEIAQTDALPMVDVKKRNLLEMSSSGVGILVKKALDLGAEKINLFLGGSATVDAGAGMLQELGAVFLSDGHKLEYRGSARTVMEADAADFSSLDPRISSVEFVGYCDVSNPLAGPEGTALVFGPQKGGTEDMLKLLDRKMVSFAGLYPGADLSLAGGGSAGGLGFAVASALGGRLASGSEYFLGIQDIDRKLDGAELVITGEGRIDRQTLDGKGPGMIARLASQKCVPVIGICGSYESDFDVRNSCFTSVFSILHGCCTQDTAMTPETATANLRSFSENLASLLSAVKKL